MTRVLREERGMALLLVLMIVAMLAALLTEFAFSTLVDLRLTETFRDSTRAYYLAKGGLTLGRGVLQLDTNKYDSRDELWAQGVPNYPVGDGVVSVFIEDQGGKLDINNLLETSGEIRKRFYRLFSALELDDSEELTGALIDWIDKDDVSYEDPESKTMIGTESNYYLQQIPPYRCKNAPLDSLGELSLIRGFTPEIVKLVTPHLTVHGTVHGSNDIKINVNTASIEVLMTLSEEPEIDRTTAEGIIELRLDEPFTSTVSLNRIKNLPGMDDLLTSEFGTFKVDSPIYRIETEGGVGDGVRRIEAFVQKTGDKLLYIKVN
jgi:general secretion pathway protein K